MRKGTAAEKSAFVPVFSIVFERTERYFCGILQCRQGMAAFLYSFHRDRRLSTPECHRRRNFSWQNVFSKYGAVSRRFCASHHCPPSVRKRSRMFHRMLITKRRWIGRPPKALHWLGQGPIFAGQAVLACTDGHVPVAGKRFTCGQREQSVHRCSAGGLFLSGGAVGRAERRHIRHLGN